MIKVVGVVGGTDDCRATVVRELAQELTGRGYQVAVLRHPSNDEDVSPEKAASVAGTVGLSGFVSERGTVLYWPEPLSMEDVIRHIDADYLIADGFEHEKTFPRISCTDGGEDGSGLAMVASTEDVGKLADLVQDRAFKLPALDCKECGFKSCHEMAQAIVAGEKTVADCVSLTPTTVVTLDGQLVPMKSFVSEIIRGTIVGMLTSLKGFHKGVIEIRTE